MCNCPFTSSCCLHSFWSSVSSSSIFNLDSAFVYFSVFLAFEHILELHKQVHVCIYMVIYLCMCSYAAVSFSLYQLLSLYHEDLCFSNLHTLTVPLSRASNWAKWRDFIKCSFSISPSCRHDCVYLDKYSVWGRFCL